MISEKLKSIIVGLDIGPVSTNGLIAAIEAEIADRVAEARAATAPASEYEQFDEAAARAGQAIVWCGEDGKCHSVEFIGIWRERVVIADDNGDIKSWTPNAIRMAPRPMRTVWVNVYPGGGIKWYDSEESAKHCAPQHTIAIAHPVQVPAK
ncbi:MAG: hypothetical protein ACRYHA_34205 [Janthinobacterium lividum]